MNLEKLLAALRAAGMKDEKPTLESVKAYIEAENVRLVDQTDPNKAVDVDAIFKAASEAEAKKSAKKAEPKLVLVSSDEEVEATDEELAEFKAFRAQKAKDNRGKGAPPAQEEDFSSKHRFAVGSSERAAYKARIAAGRAAFKDVDVAEACTAYIRLAALKHVGYPRMADDAAILKATNVEMTNTLGGALVPDEFVAQLIVRDETYGAARKVANVVRMSREVQVFPRETGVFSMSPVSESGTITSSNSTFDNVQLTAHKAGATIDISNELIEDSAINVADMYATRARRAYDNRIDSDYFNGDGSLTYNYFQGLANALPASAYFNGSGNSWSALTTPDFNKGVSLLENIDPSRLSIVMSRQAYAAVCQRLEFATSQFRSLAGGSLAGNATFMGMPVIFSQAMATATGSGVKTAYIGDFIGGSMIGERRDLVVAMSEHAGFSTDTLKIRVTCRYSVNVHGDGRASTYGPIVCLKTS